MASLLWVDEVGDVGVVVISSALASSFVLASSSERPFDDRPRAMNDLFECA